MRAKPTQSVEDHQLIVAAIRAGETTEAHDAARRHRIRARDELLPILLRNGIRHL